MKKANPTFYYLAFANLMFFLGNAIYILFPVFLKQLGAPESYIGILNNADKIFVILTSLGIASFLRIRNKIRMLRIGYILLLVAFSSYMLISSVTWLILLIRILYGIGFSIALIMGSTIVFDIFPIEDAAEAIGIYGVTGAISNAVSPFFCELLLSRGYSFYLLFFISAVLVFLSLCVTFLMPKQKLHTVESQARTGFFHVFRYRGFLLTIIATIIFGGGFGVIITYLPNFILTTTNYKFSIFFITYIFVLIFIRFQIIGRIARFNKANLLMVVFLIGALPFIFLNFLYSVLILIAVGILYGLNHGILYPMLNTLAIQIVDKEDRGKANAVFSGCFHAGMLIFSLSLGFLIDFTGTYLAAFNTIAIVFFAGILMISFNKSKFRKSEVVEMTQRD